MDQRQEESRCVQDVVFVSSECVCGKKQTFMSSGSTVTQAATKPEHRCSASYIYNKAELSTLLHSHSVLSNEEMDISV